MRGLDHTRRNVAVSIDDRRGVDRQEFAEEPQFCGKIVLDRRMIVHVVAREIGEGGRCEAHAVEAFLIEAVR